MQRKTGIISTTVTFFFLLSIHILPGQVSNSEDKRECGASEKTGFDSLVKRFKNVLSAQKQERRCGGSGG